MKSKLIFLLSLTTLMAACRKDTFDDLSGTETINGIAVLVKTFDAKIDTVPLRNRNIYLKKSLTDSSFIYSVLTDDNGKFQFTNVSSAAYTLVAVDTLTSIPYYGSMSASSAGTSIFRLYPDERAMNGLILTVYDSLSSPVNNATIYRFVNKIFFDSSFAGGVIDSVKTDNDGRVRYFNLPATNQYFIGKMAFNNRLLIGRKTFAISATGVKKDSLVLRLQ